MVQGGQLGEVCEIEAENEGVSGHSWSMISRRILLTFRFRNRTIPLAFGDCPTCESLPAQPVSFISDPWLYLRYDADGEDC